MSRRLEVSLAAVVAALGLAVIAGAAAISPGAGYDRIGPRFFPIAVGAGLLLLGLALAVSAIRSSRGVRLEADQGRLKPAPTGVENSALAYLAAALLSFLLLAERIGFIVTAAMQFWLVARAFRSRRPVRDAVVALGMSAIVYTLFSHVLGLSLPAGPLERFL